MFLEIMVIRRWRECIMYSIMALDMFRLERFILVHCLPLFLVKLMEFLLVYSRVADIYNSLTHALATVFLFFLSSVGCFCSSFLVNVKQQFVGKI